MRIYFMIILAISMLSPKCFARSICYYQNQVAVLMYHHIDPIPAHHGIITPKQFEDQIRSLVQAGFHFITMEQYIKFIKSNGSVPENAVLITFDDGYQSFYTYAYPILKKYSVSATNFIIVSTIEPPTPFLGSLPKLTWDQMRMLKKEGFSFYSHTYNCHEYLPIDEKCNKLKPKLCQPIYNEKQKYLETKADYIMRVTTDLKKANQCLMQELGNDYQVIAYPYGAYNRTVSKVAEHVGFDVTFTIKPGINTAGQFKGYRINAGDQLVETNELIYLLQTQRFSMQRKKKILLAGTGIFFVGLLLVPKKIRRRK